MSSNSPRLLVIGSANIDLCMNLPSLPSRGETLGGGTFRQTFGGKGANAAVAAAQAGGNVGFIGCVGRDAGGEEMIAQLRAKKVDTTFIERHPTAATGVAFIFIDNRGQNMIGVAPGANDQVTPARLDALRAQIKEAALILIQNEIPEETVFHLLAIAHEDGVKVLYNCAPARSVPPHLLATVEWIVLNESEAAFVSGIPVSHLPEAEIAARKLLEFGVKNVLITLGADGVCVMQSGKFFHVPGYKVNVVDTVAAGDIFCGTLAVACSEGRQLLDAVRFGSAAAAISVTRPGAQTAAPHHEEIERFLKTYA